MRRFSLFLAIAAVIWSVNMSLGCARVQVAAPKEPIKVDITMRLDVYQHVQSDIDSIENLVSGSAPAKPANPGLQSLLSVFVTEAYAQDAVNAETQAAALRRRDRLAEVKTLLESGVIGENKSGLLSVRDDNSISASARGMVNDENSDRMVIYREIAAKNGIAVEEVQKMYARRLQNDAPAGAPIEAEDGTGAYSWKAK